MLVLCICNSFLLITMKKKHVSRVIMFQSVRKLLETIMKRLWIVIGLRYSLDDAFVFVH